MLVAVACLLELADTYRTVNNAIKQSKDVRHCGLLAPSLYSFCGVPNYPCGRPQITISILEYAKIVAQFEIILWHFVEREDSS